MSGWASPSAAGATASAPGKGVASPRRHVPLRTSIATHRPGPNTYSASVAASSHLHNRPPPALREFACGSRQDSRRQRYSHSSMEYSADVPLLNHLPNCRDARNTDRTNKHRTEECDRRQEQQRISIWIRQSSCPSSNHDLQSSGVLHCYTGRIVSLHEEPNQEH